jgi:hypothetical protein
MKNLEKEIKKMIEQEGIEIPELGIKIIPKVLFKGKIYSEITDEVPEEFIASYEILQKLRNIAFESRWKKYPFMKRFYVFVPNPDKISKSKGFVSRFFAYRDGADLNSNRNPSIRDSVLGVLLFCEVEKGKAMMRLFLV